MARCLLRQKHSGRKGFTLIEIAITTLILAVAFISLMLALTYGMVLLESSRNMTQAGVDARALIEEMRRTCTSGGLAQVTATNWTTWGSTNGLTALDNEAIAVSYVDAAADPLEVTITVSWTERSRNRSETFTGFFTRR